MPPVSKTLKTTFTFAQKKAAKHFVAVLKKFLKQADLLPRELTEITGVPARTIQSWLAGKTLPSPERIADVKCRLYAEEKAARQFADAIVTAFGV